MTHKNTIRAYSTFAQAYDRSVVDFWAAFPRDFLRQFAGNLPGKRVLSLGSGSGRDALLLRELGLEVVCVDAAANMVALTAGLGFESYRATFDKLPFAEGSFDGIWAHGSLLHLTHDEARRILTLLRKLFRKNGLLAVGVIRGDGEAFMAHEIMPGHTRYFRFYQSAELQSLIAPLGFEFLYQQDYTLPYDTFINHIYRCAI